MISLISEKQVVAAIRGARSVLLTAYALRPGRVLENLEDAARRGASVRVRLEGRPYGDTAGHLIADNRRAVKALRRLGADAKLVDTNARNGPALHMKAAVCDGVAYLDDRNWPDGGDTIVRDDFRTDIAAIEAAALRQPSVRSEEFWTSKAQALAAERRLLASAAHAKRVDVESESFGSGGGAYGELKRLAQSGVPCRLIVAQRDLNAKSERALASLAQAGVAVRVSSSDEKMAIVDGARAWIGSANATSSYVNGDQIDWGLRTDAPDVLAHLRRRFQSTWNTATPLSS
ncbi:MAG TPA: phospholipase D-like domain-containing protein [Candidatus Rubrimentiphilum sp.]|nr:phospholipase D-like domain-containing protein [Candidatus Rubrimentiphilum sp.]